MAPGEGPNVSIDSKRVKNIVHLIEAAFARVAHPGDDKLLHPDCRDDMDIVDFYGGVHWRDVAPDVVISGYAAPSFFSAEGFQFYLPAYMIWALRNHDGPEIAIESTLIALDPGERDDALHDFQVSKFALITPRQRLAIVAFLEVFRDVEDRGQYASLALDHYWNGDV